MPAAMLTDTRKLCVHTITTKPLPIEVAIEAYTQIGVAGITVWRQALDGRDVKAIGRRIRERGLEIVSLCRGGFYPAKDASGRQKAIDENLRVIDEAAALGAPLIVLVCGAVPGQPLAESRRQICDGIHATLEHAKACNVKLAIEPLHPLYAADRSAVNTMKQANDLCDLLDSPQVGVAIDVYHLWFDEALKSEIRRCGRAERLFAFHVCDWKPETKDLLLDRGLMGEGCIDIREIRGWVEEAGFGGMNEVEIFSNRWWSEEQGKFLQEIRRAYLEHV